MRIVNALLLSLYYNLTTVLKNIKKLCPFVIRSQQCPAAPANSVKPRNVNYHLTKELTTSADSVSILRKRHLCCQ